MAKPYSSENLVSIICDDPHNFLQPSSDLYAAALAAAKSYLDPLAADISDLQQERQTTLRRKRKRGNRHTAHIEKPLVIRALHTNGFDTQQIWAQAKKILEAAAVELQRSLPLIEYSGNGARPNAQARDGVGHDQRAVRFRNDTGNGSSVDGVPSPEEVVPCEGIDLNGDKAFNGEDAITAEGETSSEIADEGHLLNGYEENINTPDDEELAMASDDSNEMEQTPRDTFVPDKLGLNDGFFSIDDFNRQSDFLEQQDAQGGDDGAASSEEDVDWDIDPLAVGSNNGIKTVQGDGDSETDHEEGGPTFGNANLNAPNDSDSDESHDLEGELEEMPSMQNTNDILYADFFAPPPRQLTKSARRRALPKTQPPPSSAAPDKPPEDDIQRAMADVRRDIFEDDLEPNEPDLSEAEGQPRSLHQKRQAALTAEIRRLETEAVAKKPWTLSGEARAGDRPLNSLLEEDLEFERAGKPVPVITQEVSEDIETLIKRRILNREFDEITRRRPGTLNTGSRKDVRRGRVDLDDSKPTQSLAELYEAEHLAKVDPQGYVDKRSEALKKEHEKIEILWKGISANLDALTNMHFRPKPVEVNVKVVSDVPTIMMEDARPSAGSDVGVSMLAPQEVYKPGEDRNKKVEVSTKSGMPVARDEMTREQKLRRRRREKERIKKAGGIVVNAGKGGVAKGRKAEEKGKVAADLKRGGVRVIGRKGEIRDIQGKEVKRNGVFGSGAGAYKL